LTRKPRLQRLSLLFTIEVHFPKLTFVFETVLDLIWTLRPRPSRAALDRPRMTNQYVGRCALLQNTRNMLEVPAGAISWGFKSPLRTIFSIY
jgi:hypothetical protein